MTISRPVNHNPFKYRYPVMAITSIFHRISGLIIFLSIPLLLYLYRGASGSIDHFQNMVVCLHTTSSKWILWVVLSAVIYHVLAGLRHLVMDFGFAENLTAAKVTSWVVMVLGLVAVILLGVWLW